MARGGFRPPALILKHIIEPPSKVPPGFTLEYRLGPVLGAGTTAVVKCATRSVDGKEFAVKCVTSGDDEVHRFARREYDLLMSMQHTSIINVDSFHADGPQSFMVMEIMEGGSLQSHVQKCGPFTEANVVPLWQQLLQAVNYLHTKRVVHRDLKPDNTLLARGATILKLSDFNSATRIGGDLVDGPMLSQRGAELFRSPEQLMGLAWNERVDIWACGLCLYFALKGRLPFRVCKLTTQEMFALGCVPEVCWSGLSHEIQHFLRQCLAINMCDRPPAMELLNNFDNTKTHASLMSRQVTEGGSRCRKPDADPFPMTRQISVQSVFSNPDSPTFLPSMDPLSPKGRCLKRLQQRKWNRAFTADEDETVINL